MKRGEYPKPTWRDWGLLAVGVGFTASGLLILPQNRDVGVVTIAFFGLCAVVFVITIARKLRNRRMSFLAVEIAGGVPIRPSRGLAFALGLALAALGAVLIVFGQSYGVIFRSLAWVVAVFGGGFTLAAAMGWFPAGHIQFDPEGLTIACRRWSYTAPWDSIAGVAAGDYHDNPALFIWLRDVSAVKAHPPESMEAVLKTLARSQSWAGAPIVILTSRYLIPLPLLATVVERYVAEPSARAGLARPRVTAGGAP
jgi:hypothetical protein